ncbi:MAG TPA: hypothetical protein DEH78_02615 [Solibacterales bacterium]|nr:hypothetical protein [Bryobacterales bacterium]
MIRELRQDFNRRFTPERYRAFLEGLEKACGEPVEFRNCETPCFLPKTLLDDMAVAGRELVHQLMASDRYIAASDRMIPPHHRAPRDAAQPMFVQADFGIVLDEDGNPRPRLVEIQGFPSLYCFQPTLAAQYREAYHLDPSLGTYLGGHDDTSYTALLRRAILADHDPDHVVLLEVEPHRQKTRCDFTMTRRMLGVPAVDILAVARRGDRLFYRRDDGVEVPIRRIYNRVIVDELDRRALRTPFQFSDDLDVEWAGHPNWFFRLSKFSLPYFDHPTVPRTWFLSEVAELPLPPEELVLKPLYSFAGTGVVVGPSREAIAAVPAHQRDTYILQERMDFAPLFATPHGDAKAEVRIMYVWLDGEQMAPVNTIVRMGRGRMMGVDHNKDMEWVGASAAFFPREA